MGEQAGSGSWRRNEISWPIGSHAQNEGMGVETLNHLSAVFREMPLSAVLRLLRPFVADRSRWS
jgi:hypothetical protein